MIRCHCYSIVPIGYDLLNKSRCHDNEDTTTESIDHHTYNIRPEYGVLPEQGTPENYKHWNYEHFSSPNPHSSRSNKSSNNSRYILDEQYIRVHLVSLFLAPSKLGKEQLIDVTSSFELDRELTHEYDRHEYQHIPIVTLRISNEDSLIIIWVTHC